MRRCTLLVLALLCGPPCLADTQAAAPLPYRGVMLEDQLAPDARELAFPRRLEHSLSPDGRRVAYVAKKLAPTYSRRAPTSFYSKAGVPDPYQGAAVRVLDLRTGRQREPLPGDHNTWNARWSPDGRYLAFLSDKHGQVNLFVWDSVADSLAEFRQRAVHAEMFPENSPPLEWAADSRHIVFQASIATPPPADPADWSVEVFNRKAIEDANPFAWTGKGRVDLCVVDLVRVQVRTVVSGANLLSFRVAPRGNKIALLGNLRQASKVLQNLMDLYIIEIPGEAAAPPLAWEAMQPQVKDVKEWTGQSLAWSPDGWKLAFLTSGAQASGDIFVWDARSARLTNVSEQVPAVHAGTKALDYSPKFSIWYYLSWLPDSSAVLGLTRRPEGSALWKVPVAGGAPAKLFQGAPRSWVLLMTSATSVSSQVRLVGERQLAVQESVSRQWKTVNLDTGKVTATVLEDMPAQLLDTAADAPAAVRLGEQDADLWVYRQGAQAVRVSDFAGRLASQPLGTAQSVAGFGLDGEALTGLLLLPSAASKSHPVPLIAYVYAGQLAPRPEALKDRGGESWFRNHLLARGYAVLYVSIPNHFRGQWSGAMLAPVLSQVDAAVRTGAVDPARVGVHGHSFGGYTVNMLITHTRRFKAAVSVAGIADPVASALGGAGPDTVHLRAAMTPGAQPGLGATPWDNASRYVQNSPVHHLEEVVTPLLLIHGDADISVPIDQSQALYHGLVSLEKEVEFVRYLGGNHYLNASPDMIRDYWGRVAEWYDRHLQ